MYKAKLKDIANAMGQNTGYNLAYRCWCRPAKHRGVCKRKAKTGTSKLERAGVAGYLGGGAGRRHGHACRVLVDGGQFQNAHG